MMTQVYQSLRNQVYSVYGNLKKSTYDVPSIPRGRALAVIPKYIIIGGLAALVATGCAGRGTVRQQGETLRQHGARIERQETRTYVDKLICIFKGTGYDDIFGAGKQEIIRQMSPAAKAEAEKADTVCFLPTGKVEEHYGELWTDEDKDQRIKVKIDSIHVDKRDGIEYQAFPVRADSLLSKISELMLDIHNVPPRR